MWTKKISYQKHCLLVSFSMGLLVIGGCFPIPQPDAEEKKGLSGRHDKIRTHKEIFVPFAYFDVISKYAKTGGTTPECSSD